MHVSVVSMRCNARWKRKALNDSSFVAFTVNEKTTHTHIDVCIGMCVIESVSQMELKRVCVHTVFMNG